LVSTSFSMSLTHGTGKPTTSPMRLPVAQKTPASTAGVLQVNKIAPKYYSTIVMRIVAILCL
ncbi:hypothetical protein, partial [Ruminiclostridium cellobioparum]|uniref:hypothetical protein n=1 Tax=Ruminiclostridium cellobioparum TaxID=29355 RepID=UPI0028B14AA7